MVSDTVIGQHWVSAMERFVLLPNFTLIDDSVELSVAVSHLNPETMEFETTPYEYSRGVSIALYELAPGATFYAQGIAATIDAVEIGHQGAAVEQWRLCPDCSYSEILVPEERGAGACPQCGAAAFADKGLAIPAKRTTDTDRGALSFRCGGEDKAIDIFADQRFDLIGYGGMCL